jgi:hypothetical protein
MRLGGPVRRRRLAAYTVLISLSGAGPVLALTAAEHQQQFERDSARTYKVCMDNNPLSRLPKKILEDYCKCLTRRLNEASRKQMTQKDWDEMKSGGGQDTAAFKKIWAFSQKAEQVCKNEMPFPPGAR